ncbi:hypothetical protein CP982_01725 [Streptomyces spectabilis]|uniref:Uncharacterized protein n=1 Tax=Streptomyces spectabilis TaxID=68270 RepID=A0A5P2X5B5_STRST|nr:hypothetical protein CP982_01725 [Streptomyces spectabilis]
MTPCSVQQRAVASQQRLPFGLGVAVPEFSCRAVSGMGMPGLPTFPFLSARTGTALCPLTPKPSPPAPPPPAPVPPVVVPSCWLSSWSRS